MDDSKPVPTPSMPTAAIELVAPKTVGQGPGSRLDADTLRGKTPFQIFPTGIIVSFGGSVIPDGFLKTDGSNVSRTIYARLFGVIGTTYGMGDGSTTFGLPNVASSMISL